MNCLNDVNYKDCVGKVCKSLNSGDFKVVKYNDSRNVEIQFLKTGYRKVAEMKEVRSGEVKDPYLPSVYGVGVLGTKYQSTINGVVCIGNGYLSQMKDLAREIIGDDSVWK